MNENIKKLMQKVAEDESLQAKMQAFTDMDEAYEFASSIQDGFTKEEFTDIMKKLSEKMSDNGELSDDDLASIAGGVSTTAQATIAGTVCTATAAASAAAGAAA